MFVLLPIFPASAWDRRVLRGAFRGEPLCLRLPRLAMREAGAACRVVTSDDAIAGLLREQGVPVDLVPTQGDLSYREGVRLALDSLAGRGVLDPDAPVVVANCRFPFLRPETLRRCLDRLPRDGASGVATCAPARPHPIQLLHAYRLEEADLLVFPEPETAAREVLRRFGLDQRCGVSAPFFFDWRGMNRWDDDPAAFTVRLGGHGSIAVLDPAPDPVRALGEGEPVFLRESPVGARRLLPEGFTPDAAVSAMRRESDGPVRIRREAGGDVVSFGGKGGLPGVLRIWPVAAGRVGGLRGFEFAAGAWERGLEATGDAPEGYLAVRMTQAAGGALDRLEHLGGGPLWDLDLGGGRPVHPGTSRPYCNRQEFPGLEVLDEAVLCGAPDLLRSAEACWMPVRLDEPENIALRSDLDVLWAESAGDGAAVDPHAPADTARVAGGLAGAQLPPPGPESAPRASAAALAETLWICGNLQEMLSRQGWRDDPEAPLSQLVSTRRATCSARLMHRAEDLAAQVSSRLEAPRGQARPPAQAGRLRGLDGAGLPKDLAAIDSDGASMLYACARGGSSGPGLFATFLATGEVRGLGPDRAAYCGLWFDREQSLLYARRLDGARAKVCHVDVFAADGRLVHTHPLGEDAYPAPEVLTAPRGNADSLFFVDYRGRMILELDKQRLVRRDVHHLFSGVVPADYQCVGDRLLLAVTAECLLLGQDARDGRVTLHAGEELMFPTMMAADRSSGGLCVTTVERVPAGSTPLRHWLKAFDPDMHLRSSVDMGPRFVRSMTILDQARLAVFVDHNQGVFHHAL